MNVIFTLLILSNVLLAAGCVQLRRKQLAAFWEGRYDKARAVHERSKAEAQRVLDDIAIRESMTPVEVSLDELIGAGR